MFILSKLVQNQARKLHTFQFNRYRRTTLNKFDDTCSVNQIRLGNNEIGLARQLLNKILLLRYSYFAAIGGSSDGVPPDLSAKQVSHVLRTNQFSIIPEYDPIKKIECNQLASNSPIEDRLRIARLRYNSFRQTTNKREPVKDSFLFAVVDGHGGETCADLVADRLFSYLAVAMFDFKSNQQKLIEPISLDYMRSLSVDKFKHIKKKVLDDQFVMPRLFDAESSSYRSHHLQALENLVLEEEKNNLIRFVEQLEQEPIQSVEDAINRSFKACDIDLSNEIKRNITNPISNIAVHYYLSLAASGCCVNLILIDNKDGYVASTGDCKAILGIHNEQLDLQESRLVHLSIEHDSDNINEIRRIMGDHPKEEHNSILKNNRLLGRLMPLRAFGDFSYKWTIDEMRLYLTRAFGPHIIPSHYYTPPYLIVEPEITKFSLANIQNEQSFIILATDGLWEQFANVRQILKTVVKHKTKTLRNDIETDIFDLNSATYLLRNALGQTHLRNYDPHTLTEEIVREQHERLVSFLTLPQAVVRNFRDDISVIIIYLV